MAAREGEIRASRAARLVGCHVRTIREWVRRAVDDDPHKLPGRLAHGRIDAVGRYWVRKVEIMAIAEKERSP
jgi:hypothetical protein